MHRASYYLTLLLPLLPPANKVCEGYVFTGVCLSTGGFALCLWGVLVSVLGVSIWGVSVRGSLYPGGVSVRGSLSRGVSVQGVSLWEVSVQGCVSVRETPVRLRTGGTHPTVMHSCYLRHYFLIFFTIYYT